MKKQMANVGNLFIEGSVTEEYDFEYFYSINYSCVFVFMYSMIEDTQPGKMLI